MENEFNKLLGERIRIARDAAGFTRDDLAKILDMSPVHISGMERGNHGPSLETLVKISKALGVTCDYLLTGDISKAETLLIDKIKVLHPDYLVLVENQVSQLINIQKKIK